VRVAGIVKCASTTQLPSTDRFAARFSGGAAGRTITTGSPAPRLRDCEGIVDWLDQRCASFETAAYPDEPPRGVLAKGRLPQDEGFLMPSVKYLMLRSATCPEEPPQAASRRGARLEARTTPLPADTPAPRRFFHKL
jgi:hypothetical protein